MPSGHRFDGIRQVCLVVPDFAAAIEGFATRLGLGPWKCWNLGPDRMFETTLGGAPSAFEQKLGVCWIGETQLEVIEPRTESTLHARFLRANPSGGLQHVLLRSAGLPYDEQLTMLARAGYPAAQTAKLNLAVQLGPVTIPKLPKSLRAGLSTRFAYVDSEADLGTVLEVSKMPPGISFELGIRLGKPDWVVETGGPASITGIDEVVIVAADPEAVQERAERAGIGPWAASGEDLIWLGRPCGVRVQRSEAAEVPEVAALRVRPAGTSVAGSDDRWSVPPHGDWAASPFGRASR